MNILILCKANYCRSPVCEKILDSLLDDSYIVSSRGIIEYTSPSMHQESIDFLDSKGYNNLFHNPKKVAYSELNTADIIFCLDHEVAGHIRKNFYNFFNKVKLYNFLDISISNHDPINFDKKDYLQIMNNLEKCSLLIYKWLKDNHVH